MTYRRAVLNTLLKVTEEGAFANLAVKEGFSDVQPTDVGRSTALLYTALEHLAYCDFLIKHYAKGRLQTPIRGILRLGVAELFYMETPPYAVVDESVRLTAEIGKPMLKGFVNGVLRSILRDKEKGALPRLSEIASERLEVETGYPRFIIDEYIEEFGEEFAERLVKASPCAPTVRAVYPNDISAVKRHLEDIGAEWHESLLSDAVAVKGMGSAVKDELFNEGRLTFQSVGAMLACRCLAPQPGMKVLDCCAAPGGKTAYLYDLMERHGSLTAWDIRPHRVELIKNTLQRVGIACCDAEPSDPSDDAVVCAVHDASELEPSLVGCYDAVLCDVPCSGLGGGTKPDARYRRTRESIMELAALQYSILDCCNAYLKPGGALVYSTCTVSREENEGVINSFLSRNSDFRLDSLSRFLPDSLKERGSAGMLTLYPNVDGTEGFFMARLVKNAPSEDE